eukprot:gene12564-biopygen9723
MDEGATVRPTIIKPGEIWMKKAQSGLLGPMQEGTVIYLLQEREKAFDLLDALSRSGSLPVDAATLHVVLAAWL